MSIANEMSFHEMNKVINQLEAKLRRQQEAAQQTEKQLQAWKNMQERPKK